MSRARTCGCAGLSGSEPPRFPTVEKVLVQYIARELAAGRPFYISRDLNSEVLRDVNPRDLLAMFPGSSEGMGFIPLLGTIFSGVVTAASTIGTAVITAAPSIASIAGSVASIKAINGANKIAQQQGVNIPTPQSQQIVGAVQQDIGGISPNTLLLAGAGLLAVLLLTGRRRR